MPIRQLFGGHDGYVLGVVGDGVDFGHYGNVQRYAVFVGGSVGVGDGRRLRLFGDVLGRTGNCGDFMVFGQFVGNPSLEKKQRTAKFAS
jgi:hypothetical protein